MITLKGAGAEHMIAGQMSGDNKEILRVSVGGKFKKPASLLKCSSAVVYNPSTRLLLSWSKPNLIIIVLHILWKWLEGSYSVNLDV